MNAKKVDAVKRERIAMRTGQWGRWMVRAITPEERSREGGWVADCTETWANRAFAVLVRPLDVRGYGVVIHLMIRNASGTDIPWAAKQRIKNEIVGEAAAAVEVFPPRHELVDEEHMYHLWVLPDDQPLMFGLDRQLRPLNPDDAVGLTLSGLGVDR